MPFQRLRRALLTAACALPIVLAACGGGDIVSEFSPSRVVAFGDAFSDAGQRGVRYTVNNGGGTWAEHVASRYGVSLTAGASGGTSFATGSARVTAKPDAAGDATTPTVTEQITTFLGAQSIRENDLVIVSGGIADIITEVRAANTGAQTQDQATANIRQAGRELGAQVRRVVNAGATHVLVVGTYNLGRSPWARNSGQTAFLESVSTAFNDELLISIVDLGTRVLYVDAALYFNLVTSSPAAYNYTDVTSVACNSVDPGPGIGIGAGQVNSALCTGATLAISTIGTTLFADPVYFTPAGHNSFGTYAFERFRERF
jgi:phospholipase/lecithinase/hemolysin